MSADTEPPPPRPNPFSPMAVAKITGFDESDAVDLTVETESVRQARAYLSGYLAAEPAEGDRAGEVIAVIGDYGTGKTHLANELVRQARRELADPSRAMYVDATSGTFVELHRRFVDKLGFAGVRNQVNDYYAEIVAGALLDAGLGSDVVEWLRNRDVVPQQVVERLGLMESELLREVQRTLRRVTQNRDFATALTLLLRTGYDDVVWRWLNGDTPAEVLVERGITAPIDTEVAALEAMGVLALLYGGRRASFVLVIDELDKLLSGARLDEDIAPAFEKLLEVFAGAGSCLVLCVLPEARGALRPSTRQRVSRTVEMVRLSVDEICAFIEKAQGARLGRAELAPFTRDTVRYLRDLAGGNARKVIRLCHDVFRVVDDESRRTGRPDLLVTDQMVREAENDQVGSFGVEDVSGVVRRVLVKNGWTYRQNHVLPGDVVVDFWVTFLDRVGGCAVLVAPSVLTDEDSRLLATRILAVRTEAPDSEVVLVVTGMLAELHVGGVRAALDADPLRYLEPGFDENLATSIGAVAARLGQVAHPDPMNVVRQRIEQLTRQQSSIYDHIDSLADRLDDVRGGADRRLAAIQRDIATLAKGAARAPASALPSDVDRLLLGAVEALDELTELEPMMNEAFAEPGAVAAVQRRVTAEELYDAFGVAALTRAAVLSFRTAVTKWYTGDSEPQRLEWLCQSYDDVVEFLPLFRLWPLTRSAASGRAGTEASQLSLRERVEAAVGNLSPRVQRALQRSVSAREG